MRLMWIRRLYISLCFTFLFSCQQQENHSLTVVETYDDHLVSNDILARISDSYYALHFCEGFQDDAIAVLANKKKKYVFMATTDDVVSLAKTVTLSKKGVVEIEVKIDGYNIINITPDTVYNYMLIDLDKGREQVKIVHTNITPRYS